MPPPKKSVVYRITGVPETATRDDLRFTLSEEFSRKQSSIKIKTLFSSCYKNGTQTGLIQFDTPLPISEDGTNDHQLDMDDSGVDIDQDFYGLTQLYPTKEGVKIPADIVAVTGLDGHAWGSWRAKTQSGRMWLCDFLSRDLPNCRTMIYGYNSKLNSAGIHTIEGYSRSFLEELKKVRKSEDEIQRPIIFIGHSFGGIIVVHSLVMAKKYEFSMDPGIHSIFKSTYATIFFGTPHRGFSVDDILSMINEKTGSGRTALVESIRTNSPDLIIGLDNFLSFAMQFKIVSFYEQMMSQKIVQVSGRYTRGGDYVTAVDKEGSLLNLPLGVEVKIPVDGDHSGMVKFNKSGDPTYTTILEYLGQFVRDGPNHIAQKFGAPTGTFISSSAFPSPSAFGYPASPALIFPVVRNTTERKNTGAELWKAVSSRDYSLVQRLLGEGASPSDKNPNGMTALHYAAQDGLVEIANLLMENGASNKVKDKEGHLAADLARMNGYASLGLMIQYNHFKI